MTADDPKFDPRAFGETLERIRQNRDYGQDNPRPAYDPVLRRDVVDDARHGRRIEDYKQALERAGFHYLTARQRGPYADGQPRHEGEWVHLPLGCAMTSDEICAWFATPEDLWATVEHWKMQARARKLGIVLAR